MLAINAVSKTFNKGGEAEMRLYQDLNLDIKEGEFVTIIGSNGSGKSTLLNLICGQIQPDSGSVMFEKENLKHKKSFQRFKKISRVYQDPMAGTAPSLTILENLSLALNKGNLFNLRKGVALDRVGFLKSQLKRLDLGLEDKLNIQVGKLSGGQRQALSLLMAFLNDPRLLLLDEHTAALDPKNSEIIMELTGEMIQERQITTIMVTHNLQQALEYGDRLLMFHEGKIIADFAKDEKEKLSRADLVALFVEHEEHFADLI